MKGRLTRIQKSENSGKIRTKSVEGEFHSSPQVERNFTILAEPLDTEHGIRVFSTSLIKKTKDLSEDLVEFETETGSKYLLKVYSKC